MATSVKVGSFTVSGSTGNQSVTGLGFQPKAVIFWGGELVIVGGSREYRRTLGVATGNTARWATMTAYRNATDNCDCQFKSNRCFQWNDAAFDAPQVAADFVSMDIDGFTVNVLTAKAVTINYFALGGSSVSAKAGVIDSTGSVTDTSSSYTGVGFQPKAMLFSTGGDNTSEAVTGNLYNVLGWCTSPTQQGAAGGFIDSSVGGGNPSNTNCVQLTNSAFVRTDKNAVVNGQFQLSSFNADGMTLYWKQSPPNPSLVGYLALGGSTTYRALSFTEPAATGLQSVSGVGIKPQALLFATVGKATSSSPSPEHRLMLGASDGVNRWAWGLSAQNNLSSANDPDIFDSTTDGVCAIGIPSTSTTVPSAVADVSTLDADGFTLNWTKVDGVGSQILALAIGNVQQGTTVTGVQATAQMGSAANVSGRANVPVTGSAATGSIGTATAAGRTGSIGVNVRPAGFSIAALLGATTQSGRCNVGMPGLQAVGQLGSAGQANTLVVSFLPVAGMQASLDPEVFVISVTFNETTSTQPDHKLPTPGDPTQDSPFTLQEPPRGI